LSPPDRPTSLSTSTTSSTESSCPTGFYACAAVYQGGCCRTGRDCDTTSCPAIPSTTIVSNDQTIVIPEATTTATSSGGSGGSSSGCASGWFNCADTVGGGCCPSGYACGRKLYSCTSSINLGDCRERGPSSAREHWRKSKDPLGDDDDVYYAWDDLDDVMIMIALLR
jgi:hypothetical protein